MSWYGIEGHDALVERFRSSINSNRLASTFLFVGPPGVGKRTFALQLAQCLLCPNHNEVELAACQSCESCQQVMAGTHPDVDYVSRPDNSANIPIDLLVGPRERRMREGFCYRISLKPTNARRRIGIIDDADHLAQDGANSLLKTLEEPPPGALIILIGTSEQRQLPTIRSRCQVLRFQPLNDDFLREYVHGLKRQQLEAEATDGAEVSVDPSEVDAIVQLAHGSLERAREFSVPGLSEFNRALEKAWNRKPVQSLSIAQKIQDFIKQEKDTAAKRNQLRRIVQSRLNHLHQNLVDAIENVELGVEAESAISAQIDRCLTALQQISANANLATLVECWVDDLYQLELTK